MKELLSRPQHKQLPRASGTPLSPLSESTTDQVEIAAAVSRARGGKSEAFELLYLNYRSRVEALIRKIVPSHVDTQQLTQDVFARAYFRLGQLRDPKKFQSWLMAIARNGALQALRDMRRQPEEPFSEGDWKLPRAEPVVVHREKLDAIEAACGSLPEHKRRLLHCMELGLTDQETSLLLNRTVPAIKSQKHRLRKFLRNVVTGT